MRSINEFFYEHLSKLKDQIDYEYTMDIEKKLFIEKYLFNYNLNFFNEFNESKII